MATDGNSVNKQIISSKIIDAGWNCYFRNMFRQFLNWRTLVSLLAIIIVSGTILYSSYLANKIEKEERQKVEQWVEATSLLASPASTGDTRLNLKIIRDNDDIPIIWTNEADSIIEYINLDGKKLADNPDHPREQLLKFRLENEPIVWIDPLDSMRINRYYYGNSKLLAEVRYYPIVQLLIVALFIIITVTALRSSYRSVQNQVWAGMAKETAHQLGTPVSSLEGWVEILKETHGRESFLPEIEKDVNRLRLVTDRFGKIGSTPKLEEKDIIVQVRDMVEYIRKRAGGKVRFTILDHGRDDLMVKISAPLFDWVIENLLKNALDAMEGTGSIVVDIKENERDVVIDIIDTGKGISKQNLSKVFLPGFTTKKRGWGLGLSLSKRIIEIYHKGSLTVKNSEQGKGTTFRIVLIK
jgi:signal transduction histidine kinase